MEGQTDSGFGFEFYHEGKMVTCRVAPGESDYGIFFDGTHIATIEMGEDESDWRLVGGSLDQDDIEQIGQKIWYYYM